MVLGTASLSAQELLNAESLPAGGIRGEGENGSGLQ